MDQQSQQAFSKVLGQPNQSGSSLSAQDRSAFEKVFAPQQSSYLGDIAKSIPTGLVEGASFLGGLPGDAVKWAGQLGTYLGNDPKKIEVGSKPFGVKLPTREDIYSKITSMTGPLHQPETVPGHYAETISSFLPTSLGGPEALALGAISGAGMETAGQLTEGTPYEPYAKLAAAIASPIAARRYLPKMASSWFGGAAKEVPTSELKQDSLPPQREEIGPTPDRGYPNVPVPVGQPFSHWPDEIMSPTPREPNIVRPTPGEPIRGSGPRPMLSLPAPQGMGTRADSLPNIPAKATPIPQEPKFYIPTMENKPGTTTVAKQPKDVQVYGDFQIGDTVGQTKYFAGLGNIQAPGGKITDLLLKPEKVFKQKLGGEVSKTAVTEQVPYARLDNGREVKLSELSRMQAEKVPSGSTSPEQVQEMLKAKGEQPARQRPQNEFGAPQVDDVANAIKALRRNAEGGRLYYASIKDLVPGVSRSMIDKAFAQLQEKEPRWTRVSDKKNSDQYITLRKMTEDESANRAGTKSLEAKSSAFNKMVSGLRGKDNKRFLYLRSIDDAKVKLDVSDSTITKNLNKMLREGKLKAYMENEPESPITHINADTLFRSIHEPDIVLEFLDKGKK